MNPLLHEFEKGLALGKTFFDTSLLIYFIHKSDDY